jgi:hypothetical protein
MRCIARGPRDMRRRRSCEEVTTHDVNVTVDATCASMCARVCTSVRVRMGVRMHVRVRCAVCGVRCAVCGVRCACVRVCSCEGVCLQHQSPTPLLSPQGTLQRRVE